MFPSNIIFHPKQIKFHHHSRLDLPWGKIKLRMVKVRDVNRVQCWRDFHLWTIEYSGSEQLLQISEIQCKKRNNHENETLFVCVMFNNLCWTFLFSFYFVCKKNVFVWNWTPTCFAIQCNGLMPGNGCINRMLGYSWYLQTCNDEKHQKKCSKLNLLWL